MMPTNPYEKHPEILADIKRIQERRKRRMERTPGRVKPINEIPVGGLLIDKHDKPTERVKTFCTDEFKYADNPTVYKPVETPVPGPVRLKLKRMDAVPYRPDWRDATIALLIVACAFLLAVVLL